VIELRNLADCFPISGELRTIARVQSLSVVGWNAVGLPIKDQALGVSSFKERKVNHSFDAFTASPARTVNLPKERHLGVDNRFVAAKVTPKIFRVREMSNEKLPFAQRTRLIGRNA